MLDPTPTVPFCRIVVVASFLEYSRLGNDRRPRLSSDFVVQSAATFGVERNHTDASATQQDRGRGQSESARHTQYAQRDVTLRNPLYNAGWSIKQEEYRPLLYIETHFFRNLLVTSFRKLPETSRTFRTILDYSRSFRILLDHSPAQRSSPNGLIGTCAGGDSPCAAVLAQRLIGTCTGPV